MNISCIFLFLFCYTGLAVCFDNDTVITIEPRFFFKELFQIWSLYFFRSKPLSIANSENLSETNSNKSIKILKNVSELDVNEDQNRIFPCLLNKINYWNYKNGAVKIPIVLQIDRPIESDNSKSIIVGSNSSKTKKPEPKKCTFIFIYAKWCRFSMEAVPVFNSLGRLFPQLEFIALAINDFQEFKWNLHTSYVPRIKMYFGNKAVREFNGSDNVLEDLVEFIFANTGQLPYFTPELIKEDFYGPISNQIQTTGHFWLIISWLLTILCSVYLILSTPRGRKTVISFIRYFR